MKKWFLLFTTLIFMTTSSYAVKYYGPALCNYPEYNCVKVGRGQTWQSMFPNPKERDIVQRINRTYNYLWAGKTIAIPRNLKYLTLFDVSPFPLKIKSDGARQIIVDQDKLAYAAYDKYGNLVIWGPIATGMNRCPRRNRSCLTITGVFHFFSKENKNCRSRVFPIGRGGAHMPYCMYFHKGFAMHGDSSIPGYRASHGCVRIFTRDAKWLNEHFVSLANDSTNQLGTKITILPVTQ